MLFLDTEIQKQNLFGVIVWYFKAMKEKINRQDVLIDELTTRVRCDVANDGSNRDESK